jgi:hypothetical protein
MNASDFTNHLAEFAVTSRLVAEIKATFPDFDPRGSLPEVPPNALEAVAGRIGQRGVATLFVEAADLVERHLWCDGIGVTNWPLNSRPWKPLPRLRATSQSWTVGRSVPRH